MKQYITLALGFFPFVLFGQFIPLDGDALHRPVGARSLVAGVSYVAFVDDATAIYWNPGALGMMRHASITGGGWMTDYTFTSISDSLSYSGSGTLQAKTKVGFNDVSVAIPIPFNDYSDFYFVPAFSYHEHSNSRPFKGSWSIGSLLGSEYSEEYTYELTGGKKEWSIGCGLGIGEHFGVGFAYNRTKGGVEETSTYSVESYSNVLISESKHMIEQYFGSSVTLGVRASSTNASDNVLSIDEGDYGEGVDFGMSLTLPSQSITSGSFQGPPGIPQFYTRYKNDPLQLTSALAIRTPLVLVSFGLNYINYKSSYTSLNEYASNIAPSPGDLVTTPDSLNGRSLTKLSLAAEMFQGVRLGVHVRNYQFKQATSGVASTYKQPWTFGISFGLSMNLSQYVFWDICGMIEFIDWHQQSLTNPSYNIKGATFNVMSSLRITLPYSEL